MIDMVNVMLIENLIKTFNFQVFYLCNLNSGFFYLNFQKKKKKK